jgi:hypothetical protein
VFPTLTVSSTVFWLMHMPGSVCCACNQSWQPNPIVLGAVEAPSHVLTSVILPCLSLTVPRSLSRLIETIYLESWCSSDHINYSSRKQVSRKVSKVHMLAKTCPRHKTRTCSKTTLKTAIRCYLHRKLLMCEGRFGWSDSRLFLRI